jgi:hypothetical protein
VFGKPWAASGESRPRHFRTPLAWVPGAGSGVLMVQEGVGPHRSWLLLSEWEDWVAEVSAAPVEPPGVVREARPSDDVRDDETPPWTDVDQDDA